MEKIASKKTIYIIMFTFLGILLGFLAYSAAGIWYINFLLGDNPKYGLDFSWPQLYFMNYVAIAVLLTAGAALGFTQGKYWWEIIYVKKIRRKRCLFKR